MAEGFEHILDECIDRLQRGESVEQCLKRYPEQAAELEPLLQVALAAQQASSVEPRPEFRAQARQQLRSVLYKPAPGIQLRQPSPSGQAKSMVMGLLAGFRSRPVFQKAMASLVVIALVAGLALFIPPLLRQPGVALAEETAMQDPGVQILLAESGFQPSSVNRIAVKSNVEDVYHVQFMNPANGTTVGIVTVNIKEKVVTGIELGISGEQYTRPSSSITVVYQENIIQIARNDSDVQEILNRGAEIGKMSYLASTQREIVGLVLQSGEKKWVVSIDPVEREVISISRE